MSYNYITSIHFSPTLPSVVLFIILYHFNILIYTISSSINLVKIICFIYNINEYNYFYLSVYIKYNIYIFCALSFIFIVTR